MEGEAFDSNRTITGSDTWREGLHHSHDPHLTFDVRGGPLAGRPLDGGVRPLAGVGDHAFGHTLN